MSPRTKHRPLVRPFALAALLVPALMLALAPGLSAQILRVPGAQSSGPPIHVSAEIGFLDTQGRYDGPSQSYWNLGQGIQYRASLSIGTRMGAFGVSGSTASLPVAAATGLGVARGDVDLRMLLATFRSPHAPRLHQVIEVSLGMAQWTGLDTDMAQPTDAESRNAFALLLGYGIGIPLGSRATVSIVQDLGTIVGSKAGVPAGTTRVVRQYTTRLGLRLRLAGRRS